MLVSKLIDVSERGHMELRQVFPDIDRLKHWGRDKMAVILQKMF